MRVETRTRKINNTDFKLSVILLPETEVESHAIDLMLGDCGAGPVSVKGEVRLSDGYGEHYIELEAINTLARGEPARKP